MAGIFDFGGQNLADMYNNINDRDAVFNYLDQVIANGATLNPPIDEATTAELQAIRNQIEHLSVPQGQEYVGTQQNGLDPTQHIRRQQTRRWRQGERQGGVSKFGVAIGPGQSWRKQRPAALRYWSPFDLLGLFFSKMGPAPNFATATEANFYLPLTAAFARFCMWIGLNKRPALTDDPDEVRTGQGVGDPPYYFQCTWDRETGNFFLGAVLAGYEWARASTGNWKATLRRSRYDLLTGFHNFPGAYLRWDQSPTINAEISQTRFGNCAETYPFLEMLGPHYTLEERRRMEGIALQRDFSSFHQYAHDEIRGRAGPPCLNCRQLLTWAGIVDPMDWRFNPRKARQELDPPAPEEPAGPDPEEPVAPGPEEPAAPAPA